MLRVVIKENRYSAPGGGTELGRASLGHIGTRVSTEDGSLAWTAGPALPWRKVSPLVAGFLVVPKEAGNLDFGV